MVTSRQGHRRPVPSALLTGLLFAAGVGGAASAADSDGTAVGLPIEAGSPIQKALINVLDGADPGSLSVGGITLYGIFDVDLSYQSHGAPPSPYMNGQYLVAKNSGGSRFDFTDNAMSQSVIGIRTEQPLDDLLGFKDLRGWAVTADVASGFDPAFGAIQDSCKSLVRANGSGDVPGTASNSDATRCGQFFNGEAWGGVKSDSFGELRFGRQNSLMFDDLIAYDPQKGSYVYSLFGSSGVYGGGFGSSEDRIWNDALKFKTGIGPVRFSAQYRFQGAGQGGKAYAFGGRLDGWGPAKGLAVDFIWGQFNDAIVASSLTNSATKANGSCQYFGVSLANCSNLNILNATISDNTAWAAMVKYNLGAVGVPSTTVMAGYQGLNFANPKDNLASGYKTIGGYLLNYTGTSFTTYTTDKRVDLFWTGARWNITPKLTAAGAWYYYVQNSYVRAGAACTNPGSGTATQAQCKGNANWYSASLDYQLTKRLDLYTGISFNGATGGITNGDAHSSTTAVATGARFRF